MDMERAPAAVRRRLWRRRVAVAAALTVLGLVALRLAASAAAHRLVERTLVDRGLLAAPIGGIDLGLLAGQATVRGMRLRTRLGDRELTIELPESLVDWSWTSVLAGDPTAEVRLLRPRLVVMGAHADDQPAPRPDVAPIVERVIDRGLPFRLRRLAIEDGTLVVRREVDGADLQCREVTMVWWLDPDTVDGARLAAHASVAANGQLHLGGTLDPDAPLRAFEIGAVVRDLPLAALAPWVPGLGEATGRTSPIDLYAQLSAVDGRMSGYVKPLADAADVADVAEDLRRRGLDGLFVETGAVAAGEAPEGDGDGPLMNRIPIRGTGLAPDDGSLAAFGDALRAALAEPLRTGLQQPARRATVAVRASYAIAVDDAQRSRLRLQTGLPPVLGLRLTAAIAADGTDGDLAAVTGQFGVGYAIDLAERLALGAGPFIGSGVALDDGTAALFTYGFESDLGWSLDRFGIGLDVAWVAREAEGADQDGDDILVGAWIDWRF